MLAGPDFFTYWGVLLELAASEPKEMDVCQRCAGTTGQWSGEEQTVTACAPEHTVPALFFHSLQAAALGAAPRPSCFPMAVFSASMRGHNVSASNAKETLSD